jgi:hypothetical protein
LLKLQKHYHPNKILEIPCKEKSEKGGGKKEEEPIKPRVRVMR